VPSARAVSENWTFADYQNFTNSSPGYFFVTSKEQGTTTDTVAAGGRKMTTTTVDTYPIAIALPLRGALTIGQGFFETRNSSQSTGSTFSYSQDSIDARQGAKARTTDHFVLQNSSGYCYDQTLAAANGRLLTNQQNCPP
jgi:hypothetical protein